MFNKSAPLFLVALVANFANVAFFVGGIQLLFIDRLLPREIGCGEWARSGQNRQGPGEAGGWAYAGGQTGVVGRMGEVKQFEGA
jgi:hypothetical protein